MRNKLSRYSRIAMYTLIGLTYAVFFLGEFWTTNFTLSFAHEIAVWLILFGLPIVLIYQAIRRRWKILLVMGVGFVFLIPRYGDFYGVCPSVPKSTPGEELKVLSFNASFFRAPSRDSAEYYSPVKKEKSLAMIDWLVNFDADLFCIQEFFSDSGSVIFDVPAEFHRAGVLYGAITNNYDTVSYFHRSVAIFSRHPVVGQGEIFADTNGYNRGMYADIRMKTDTIRVFNMHLHSSELKSEEFPFGLIGAFYEGTLLRYQQALAMVNAIEKSPHPVLLVGDINQTIYSILYKTFKERLQPTFDTQGNGTCATLNSNSLFFLRIDHQFHDEHFSATSYCPLKEMKYSYHFPVLGTYRFSPSRP